MATPATAKVLADALALSPSERRDLVNDLLMSTEPPAESPEWTARVKVLLEQRWQEYQAGDLGEPYDDAIAELHAELHAIHS